MNPENYASALDTITAEAEKALMGGASLESILVAIRALTEFAPTERAPGAAPTSATVPAGAK